MSLDLKTNQIGIVSLGCSKNRVDTEILLGYLKAYGFQVVNKPEKADILIINTCGFIESAKQESIDTILEMAAYKDAARGQCQMLVVTGCLSQRYMEQLEQELPEVDLLWGVKNYPRLAKEIAAKCGRDTLCGAVPPRVLTTPSYSAYLRIADGCSNCCTYCAIPLIRGERVSVPEQEVVDEAKRLVACGVKEITLIAQDTSAYGLDLYGKPRLAALLQKLSRIDGVTWLRVLYAYPDTITDELIDTMVSCPNIANYIDMPIQHINDQVLCRMNRRGTTADIMRIYDRIRSASDSFILRTTALVGFPGETEAQFQQLKSFLKEYPFDRLGAFAYSPEDDTPAAIFADQIEDSIKKRRLAEIMEQQSMISLSLNKKREGDVVEVLIDSVKNNIAYARSYAEAPEVDGTIYFPVGENLLKPGDMAKVKLLEAFEYDIRGMMV